MTDTANLKLPLVAAAQAQKHVTVNEALSRIDAALQLTVESRTQTTPPTLVEDGVAYLVPVGAVNDWSGHEEELAFHINGGWDFITPRVGWSVFVRDESARVTFGADRWLPNALAFSPQNAAMQAQVIEFDFDLTAGAFAVTGPVIPASSVVFGVTGRVITAISGTLSEWELGVPGSDARYGSGLGMAAGSWLRGITGQPLTYYSPTALKLTATGGDFAAGTVRLAIHTMQFSLPEG